MAAAGTVEGSTKKIKRCRNGLGKVGEGEFSKLKIGV